MFRSYFITGSVWCINGKYDSSSHIIYVSSICFLQPSTHASEHFCRKQISSVSSAPGELLILAVKAESQTWFTGQDIGKLENRWKLSQVMKI